MAQRNKKFGYKKNSMAATRLPKTHKALNNSKIRRFFKLPLIYCNRILKPENQKINSCTTDLLNFLLK